MQFVIILYIFNCLLYNNMISNCIYLGHIKVQGNPGIFKKVFFLTQLIFLLSNLM